VMGFRVDTLWALKRLTSSTSGGRKEVGGLECLGEGALLRFKDDVLVSCVVERPSRRGKARAGQLGGVDPVNHSSVKGRLCRTTRPRGQFVLGESN
jgi:hypothetical protein